jgi:hypothetical protein
MTGINTLSAKRKLEKFLSVSFKTHQPFERWNASQFISSSSLYILTYILTDGKSDKGYL